MRFPSIWVLFWVVAVSISTSTSEPARAQPVSLAADVNKTVDDPSTIVSGHVATESRGYFSVLHPVYGMELWTHDPAVGARLVADLCPGRCSSFPVPLAERGGDLIFSADGRLWITDGSDAGTVPLYTSCRSCAESDPQQVAVVGERIFFSPFAPNKPLRLWLSDGTFAGTAPLAVEFPVGSFLDSLTAVGDRLFFFVYTDDPSGGTKTTLWTSDGTAEGTGAAVPLCDACGFPTQPMTAVGDRLFFQLFEQGFGAEPWTSDGTAEGTRRLADLTPGDGNTTVLQTALFEGDGEGNGQGDDQAGGQGDRLYGLTGGRCEGVCIFVTDGTPEGTRFTPELQPPLSFGNPQRLGIAGSRLYVAMLPLMQGVRASLWQASLSGGTPARIIDANTLDVLGRFEDDIVFQTWNVASGEHELFRFSGLPSSPRRLATGEIRSWTAAGSSALFFRFGDDDRELEVWTSDGTVAGTAFRLDPTPPHSSSFPRILSRWQDDLAVQATDGPDRAPDLWQVGAGGVRFLRDGPIDPEGTEVGDRYFIYDYQTEEVVGFGLDGSQVTVDIDRTPEDLVGHRDRLFLSAGSPGLQLWTASPDGGAAELLVDTYPGWSIICPTLICPSPFPLSHPAELTPFGDDLFFVSLEPGGTGQETSGPQIWASDGTAPGTRKIVEMALDPERQYPAYDYPSRFVVAGEQLYFEATDAAAGREIWRTDGTSGGTRRLTDIEPGAAPTAFDLAAPFGSDLLTVQRTGTGHRLWQVSPDGTTRRRLTELGERAQIYSITEAGGRAFVVARTPAHGQELWILDPIDASGKKGPGQGDPVLDLYPGPRGSGALVVAALPDGVLFAADDGSGIGQELWVSGGSSRTTRLVADILPGSDPSGPGRGVLIGDRVYFPAEDPDLGRELLFVDLDALGPVGEPPCPADRLCLLGGRFEVHMRWQTLAGAAGDGRRVAATDESGLFWFFTDDNWESMVKLLDGCAVNGHFWVFGATSSDVGYELTVTDTESGANKVYANAAGIAAPTITDIEAFACAP